MNKKEIMNKISEMECEIKLLKEELNKQEEPKRRWKPDFGEDYYYFDSEGRIIYDTWNCEDTDTARYLLGNVFKTFEEASFAVEQLKVLAELKEYADDDKEWNNNKHICVDYEIDKVCVNEYYLCTRNIPFNLYFSSEEQARKAVDAIGEGRLKKYYFCVED